MRTKEVCRLTGLSVKSLRLYEEQGLISPARESRNGRVYRDYSAEDVEELNQIAVLRKARFTMAEIRMMQEQPELVPAIYENYLKRLRTEAEELSQLVRTAEQILPETMNSHSAVAAAIAAGAEPLPLPKRDVQPHFGKFDEETPEERAALFAGLRNQRRQTVFRALKIVGCAAVFCLVLTLCVALFQRSNMDLSELTGGQWKAENQRELMELLHKPFSKNTVFTSVTLSEGAGILLDANGEIVMTAEPFFDAFGDILIPVPDDAAMWELIERNPTWARYSQTLSSASEQQKLGFSGNLHGEVLELTRLEAWDYSEQDYVCVWGGEYGDTTLSGRHTGLFLHSSEDYLYLLDETEPADYSRSGFLWNTVYQCRGSVTCQGETYTVVYFGCENYLTSAVRTVWPLYLIAALTAFVLLLSRSFMPANKSFLVTRQYVGKMQKAVDHVVIYDRSTNKTTVYGELGSGNVSYSTKASDENDSG